MIGEVVLFHDGIEALPAVVCRVVGHEDGSQELDLIVLGADIDVMVGRDDAGEPAYGDRATARAVRARRGQPGKDAAPFWSPRA